MKVAHATVNISRDFRWRHFKRRRIISTAAKCDVWQEFIKRIGLINIQSYFLYVRLTYRFRNIRGPSFFLLPKRVASNLILLVKVCAGQATLWKK